MSAPATRLREAWPTLAAALAVLACLALLALSGGVRRIDAWIYDALLARMQAPADPRIVVVAIDEQSLAAMGRWPWPRATHARLLDALRAARPRGIAFDVSFSEPDPGDPAGDRALARAVARAGNVVLPVLVEASEPGGVPIEVLPLPVLAQAAAGLGHAAVDVDRDGVARRTCLRAGLGDAHWPALAAALLARGEPTAVVAGAAGQDSAPDGSPYLWRRSDCVLVPYTAAGDFQQVSYVDVVRGRVPPRLLQGRLLLVGVTAQGAGDGILTPLPGVERRMPGVLYQANLLQMLLRGDAIAPLAPGWRWALTIGPALLAVLLLRLRRRRAWWALPAVAALVLLASAWLLWQQRVWLPPATALAGLLAAFVMLALHRLRRSHRMAHSDALTRLANRRQFDATLERELAAARRSGRPLSLLLIDVDHFKHYNDTYGHRAGDEMLRAVARAVARHARRPRDLPVRYGGDELAAILPETGAAAAGRIAEAMVRGVRELRIPHAGGSVSEHVTVSIGIACHDPQRDPRVGGAAELLERTDRALYRAKQLGRNRSHAASEPEPAAAQAPTPA